MSRAPSLPCGTRARYVAGCHCDACTDANRRYHREHRIPTGQRNIGPQITIGPLPAMTWTHQAACRGHDPNLWFRDEHDSTSYQDAKAICATCPVTNDCLAWALDTNTEHGVFGGLTPRQRKHLQPRRRRIAGHSTPDFLWTIALFLFIVFFLDRLGALR